jgi:hypothetical protein
VCENAIPGHLRATSCRRRPLKRTKDSREAPTEQCNCLLPLRSDVFTHPRAGADTGQVCQPWASQRGARCTTLPGSGPSSEATRTRIRARRCRGGVARGGIAGRHGSSVSPASQYTEY